ncbi:hypothetical protein D9M69_630120 [compost metagenome]
MHVQAVFAADFLAELADCFDKAQAFVVTHRSTDFNDVNVTVFTSFNNCFLDRLSQVRYKLHRFAPKLTRPLIEDQLRQ